MAKKRVSLTLSEELVEKIDVEAEDDNVNRSQMVEEMIDSYFDEQEVDTAVVFCGDPEAKSMDRWRGEPVLKHVLDNLSSYVSKAYLLTGPNQPEIESFFGSSHNGMFLEYFSDKSHGTASALKQIEKWIEGTFIAANGHVISDVDIDEMRKVHREEENPATMALTTVEDPTKYGVARLKGRKILGFEEKPSEGEEPSRLINAGTYLLEPQIVEYLNEETIEEVFENLARDKKLTGYIYGGEWKDIRKD